MNQYMTHCESKLYTLQPGDATMYTFMISKLNSEFKFTKEYAAVSTVPDVPLPYGMHYEKLVIPESHPYPNYGLTTHFSGFSIEDTLYLVSIFNPSQTCFAISERQLSMLRDNRTYIVDYIISHVSCANRYTVYVVLACLESLKYSGIIPDEINMQKALISALDIIPFINAE